jgi:hypothetical protein
VDYEKIENYITGGLSAAEKAAFEQEMAANPALMAEVELYRQVDAQMSAATAAEAGAPALQRQLEALNRQYFGQSSGQPAPVVPMKKRRWPYYLTGAVAAAVLAFVLVRPLLTANPVSTDSLYAEFAQYNMATDSDRGNGTANQSAAAISLFNKREFAKALPLLNRLSAADTSSSLALALAACYTETGDSARAMGKLQEVEARWQSPAAVHSRVVWYKALLLLKYKNVEGCRQALQTIPADSDFGDNATALLKKLR